jgi:hypothetical protein
MLVCKWLRADCAAIALRARAQTRTCSTNREHEGAVLRRLRWQDRHGSALGLDGARPQGSVVTMKNDPAPDTLVVWLLTGYVAGMPVCTAVNPCCRLALWCRV